MCFESATTTYTSSARKVIPNTAPLTLAPLFTDQAGFFLCLTRRQAGNLTVVILLAILMAWTHYPIAFEVLMIAFSTLETSPEALARLTEVTLIISLVVETRHLGSASSDNLFALATDTVVAPTAVAATPSHGSTPKSSNRPLM